MHKPDLDALGSVSDPFGTSATLDSGFRFTALAAPITLAAGNHAVIAYGLSNTGGVYGDSGGIHNGGNFAHADFDPFQFTSNASPAFPSGGDSNNHSSASFRFDPVPEPSGIVLLGLRRRDNSVV